jgi:hypothetical protein
LGNVNANTIDSNYFERNIQKQEDDIEDDDEGEQCKKIHVHDGGGGV